ncbi:hypothetical protein RN001_005567 [Aquatica leii]|uniref:Uncharacterized protein n=1 Tax=Aquatica leii TaxID=1421715 RepID=A0AAN7PCV7_9COLE|nr:hypothetical protein RN001_005567 [Aquatica leii]
MLLGMLNEFAVVYFCSDKTTSKVPVKWLTENGNVCWWPPTRYASAYIVNKFEPDPRTWTKHAVKVEFYCASLTLARKKADDLNCTTDDDVQQRGRGQRKLKTCTKFKGDSADSETDTNGKFWKCIKLNLYIFLFYFDSHAELPQIDNYRSLSSLRPNINILDFPIVIAEEGGGYSQAVGNTISNTYAVEVVYFFYSNPVYSLDLLLKQIGELQQQTKEILLYQKSIDKRLSNIEQNRHQFTANKDHSMLMSLLPINSIDALKQFEALLISNEEIQDGFKSYISNVGGKSPRDNVYRIFEKIYTNDLANLCS